MRETVPLFWGSSSPHVACSVRRMHGLVLSMPLFLVAGQPFRDLGCDSLQIIGRFCFCFARCGQIGQGTQLGKPTLAGIRINRSCEPDARNTQVTTMPG